MADTGRHRPSLKQQNKAYKGHSKSKRDKSGRTVPTASHTDWVLATKSARKNLSSQKRKHQRELNTRKTRGLDNKVLEYPRVIGIISMNSEADCESIKQTIIENCVAGDIPQLPETDIKVFVNVIPRNEMAVLDWGKIVDVIVAVFSCGHLDTSKAKLDPGTCCAFDEMGYKILSLLRTQGIPPVLGVIQNLESNPAKKQKDIKKLFNRYYESEFPNSSKLSNILKPFSFIKNITTSLLNFEEPGYKSFRSYMWAHNVEVYDNRVKLTGYLRGTGHYNPNSLVHVTGIGDFAVSLLGTPNGEFVPDNPDTLVAENDPGVFSAEQTWPTDMDLADAFSKLEVKTDHPPADIDEEEDESNLEISDEEKQTIEFEDRGKDELDFPDEVNTPHDQPARLRFQKYRGLASFRTSEWDPYENLPQTYGKLYEFKEPNHIIKKHGLELSKASSKTEAGMIISLIIDNFPINCINPQLPIIVSSLLPYERKLSVLNFKLERWGNTQVKVLSKETVFIHYGFRRVYCKPVYSEDDVGDKHKYLREFSDNGYVIGSIFAPVIYPLTNVLVYKDTMDGPELIAVGSLQSFDPKRLIIKRILLTGYPLKVLIT